MRLEDNQNLDNDVKVHAGNISASNDSTQWIHDSNEHNQRRRRRNQQLTLGAEGNLALQKLNIRPEDYIALKLREGLPQTPESAAMTDAFMDAFDASMPAELDGVKYEGEEEWAFGQDQSDFQTRYKKTSNRRNQHGREFYSPEDQSQVESTWEEYKEPIFGDFESTRMGKDAYGKRWPYTQTVTEPIGYVGDGTPTNAMRDALDRLRQGTQKFGYDAFPGSLAAEGDLELHLNLDSAADGNLVERIYQRESDQSQGREQVRKSTRPLSDEEVTQELMRKMRMDEKPIAPNRPAGIPSLYLERQYEVDREAELRAAAEAVAPEIRAQLAKRGFNSEIALEHRIAAADRAEAIARNQNLTVDTSIADAAFRRMGNINGLGVAAKHFYHRPGANQLRVSTQQNYPSAAMVNGVYADPRTGEPLAVQGPAQPLAKSNTPNTHQQLNAPQSSREWVGSQIEGMRADPFPQADINASTALFSQRLAPILQKFGIDTTKLSPNVRSLAEVDKAVEMVVRLSKGSRLLEQRVPGTVPGTFKRVAVENPGLEQVLGAMRYSDVEKAQFANALYALTMQEQSSVNQEATRRYQSRGERAFADGDVTFDAPRGGKSVQGARIPGGRKLEGSTIVSQLRGLSGRAGGERLSEEELRAARSPRQGLAINPDGSTEQPRIDRRVPAGMDSTDAIAKEKRERMEGYAAKAGKKVDEAALRKHTVGAQLAYLRQKKAEAPKPAAELSLLQREFMARDAAAAAQGEARLRADNRRELLATAERMGRSRGNSNQMMFGGQIVPNSMGDQAVPNLVPSEITNNPISTGRKESAAPSRPQTRQAIDRSDLFGGGTIPPKPEAREQEIRVERTMRPPGQTFGQQGPRQKRPAITSQPDGPTNIQGVRNEILRRAKLGRDMRATALGVGGGVLALAGINGLINRDQGGL